MAAKRGRAVSLGGATSHRNESSVGQEEDTREEGEGRLRAWETVSSRESTMLFGNWSREARIFRLSNAGFVIFISY